MFQKTIENIKKYLKYIAYILVITLIILTIKFRHERLSKKNNNEQFTNYKKKNQNLQIPFQNEKYSVNYTNNLPLIVMKNSKAYSMLNFGVLENGTISFELCKFIRKYIYPIKVFTFNNYFDLYNNMINNNIHLSFIPEDILIKSVNKNDKYINTVLNLYDNGELNNDGLNNDGLNNNLDIIVPAYYETMFLISTDTNKIYTIEDIEKIDPTTNQNKKIGIWNNSKYYFQIVCKNKNIVYDDNSNKKKFNSIYYNDLASLFAAFLSNQINAIFLICHPKNTYLQNFMETDYIKRELILIDFYKNNNDKINTSFINNMKTDINWLFKDNFNIKKVFKENISKKYLNTFNIRTLLTINNSTEDKIIKTEIKLEFIDNLIKEYQSLNLFAKNWNYSINLDNNDDNSFDFNSLSSIPKELNIDEISINKLQKINKLVIN
tara:strand:+ start:110 stop:1414 length:1305 start_codon:yes stop_codon:yes gene_type:complete